MVMMHGRNPVEFDAAAGTLLANAVTHTGAARTANTAVATGLLTNAYWDNDELPQGWFAVNINITANAINGGGDTITFRLEGHTANDFSSARTQLGELVLTDAAANDLVGLWRFAVDAKTAKKLVAATHFALSTNLSDTVVSVSYSAWLSHLKAS